MCCRHVCIAYSLLIAIAATCRADILRWDNWQVIPGTEGIEPSPGLQLEQWNTQERNLRYAQLAHKWDGYELDTGTWLNLSGANFRDSWLDDADFSFDCWDTCGGADLENADFSGASLARANLCAQSTAPHLKMSLHLHQDALCALAARVQFDSTLHLLMCVFFDSSSQLSDFPNRP